MRRQVIELDPYTNLCNKYIGKTAFVLGCGPSLYGLDLSKIHNHVVICVNSAITLMLWRTGKPDNRFWISNDAFCRLWSFWKQVKGSSSIKIVRNSWNSYFRELKGFHVFWPRATEYFEEMDFEEDGLCHCSSVPSALDLALQLGCKKVFLLGVDHHAKKNKYGQMIRYFWQYWDKKDQPKFYRSMHNFAHQQKIFSHNNMDYKSLKKFAKYKEAKIYNCNTESRMLVFPRITLNEAFDIIGKNND